MPAAPPLIDAPRREIIAFTSLRGLAAWWVVFYHFAEVVRFPGAIGRFVAHGDVAVDVFFVMSGFVMAMSYGDSFAAGVTRPRYARFLTIRLGRIYPLHIVVLCAFALIPLILHETGRASLPDRYPLGYFMQSVFLVQNWGFAERLAWSPTAWSISTEFLFYLIFPALAYACAKLLEHRAGLALVGGVAIAALFARDALPGGFWSDLHRWGGVLRCLSEGILGVWVFHVSRWAPPGPRSGLVALGASAGLATLFGLGLGNGYPVLPIAFACLIWALIEPGHIVGRVMAAPVLRWLGEISYSTYLVHFFLKDVVKFAIGRALPGPVLLPVYALLVLAASVLLHRLIEEPGRLLGRRLANRYFAMPPGRQRPHTPVAGRRTLEGA
jgi:peptidoglycan/LPS O-acetylase OafA/YrhL